MQGRGRLLIIVAFVVIIAVVIVLVVLPGLNQPTSTGTGGTTRAQVSTATPTQPTATPISFVEIVIAVQQVPRGVTIRPDFIEVRPWPEMAAPFDAVFSTEDVIGKIARTDIFREQPILQTMLVTSLTDLAKVGSDAAAILPGSLVGVAVPMDRITSVAYAVQAGDRVDVVVSMLFVDVDDSFQSIQPNSLTLFQLTDEGILLGATLSGRTETTTLGNAIISPSEPQRPRLVTQRTIQDALVIHTGDFPRDGRLFKTEPTPTPVPTADPDAARGQQGAAPTAAPTPIPSRPDIITLGVTPQDAVILSYFVEAKLPITFLLRSATDTSQVPTEAVTLDFIMNSFRIEAPGKRSFAIEPAITSIRQLLASQEIKLRSSAE